MSLIDAIQGLVTIGLLIITFEQGRRYGRKQFQLEHSTSKVIRVNGRLVEMQ